MVCVFFFNDPATSEIYTLSLHDALPIYAPATPGRACHGRGAPTARTRRPRSEEHTSELQSRFDLVCRLLLEKKKSTRTLQPTEFYLLIAVAPPSETSQSPLLARPSRPTQ